MLSFIFAAILSLAQFENLEHATVSVYAVNMKTGEIIADENSDKSLMPASSLKIVTTAAAIELLGPDFQFETKLEYDSANLYIRGGGDPCLGSDRHIPWKKQIEAWSDSVQQKKIEVIEGDVIGDASLWERGRLFRAGVGKI